MENVRYEYLFGINNRGPNFENGVYIGSEDTLEDFMNEVTTVLVKEFDARIGEIERMVNLIFSMKWIIIPDNYTSEISCIRNGPFATSCEDTMLGDFTLPICETCDTENEINKWYDQVVKVTGQHIDPRIEGADINWPYFGNRLVMIFERLKNKPIAKNTDWRKMAHLVRAYLMYELSIKMTEKMLHKIDFDSFGYLDCVNELMGRNRQEESKNIKNYKHMDALIEGLFNHLVEAGHLDDLRFFKKMTTVEGFVFRRNEREDNRFVGADYEKDEYISIEYTKKTEDVGEVYGRFLAGRKRVLFDPLGSELIEQVSVNVNYI